VALGAALQARFERIIKVANQKLRHFCLQASIAIMIAE